MPRAKRGLSEADTNARVKTARTGKTGSKTDATIKVTTKEVETENQTAARKEAVTRKKAAAEPKATTKKSGPATKKSGPATKKAAASKPTGSKNAANPSLEWVTYCRPYWDRRSSDDSGDEDDEDEDEDEDGDGSPHGRNCKCKKPLSENPDWPWAASKDGYTLALKWRTEQMKRCQEEFDVYLYNDYNGYGIAEVVDNMLVALDKELKKKRVTPLKLWAQLEGMSIFLVTDIAEWFGCDDSDGTCARIRIIGNGLLTALSILESHDLLDPATTTLKNIPMTLALFLTFANDWRDIVGDDEGVEWKTKVVSLAKSHSIVIKGPSGMEKMVEEIEIDSEEEEEEDEESWEEEFSEFKADYSVSNGGRAKLGGNHYDLTKMPKGELMRMRY